MTNSFKEDRNVLSRRGDVRDLTEGLAVGDEKAFRRFHELYFDRIFRYVLVLVRGDTHAARDAAQETYLRIARHAKAFEDEDAFWRWLTVLAKSAVRDAMRRNRSYSNLLARLVGDWMSHWNGEPHRDDESHFRDGLEIALSDLSENERLLIESKYFDGSSVRSIAEKSGATERSVESRLLRTRRKLREIIERNLTHE